MKILIVDDSKAVHAFMTQVLEAAQHSLTHVFDGSQALAMLGSDATFDLILMDWEMPVMDGPTALGQLRALGYRTPLVMVTTKNDPASISRALQLGATDYVMKPFTQDILLAKVAELLEGAA